MNHKRDAALGSHDLAPACAAVSAGFSAKPVTLSAAGDARTAANGSASVAGAAPADDGAKRDIVTMRAFRLDHVDFIAMLRDRDWQDTSDIRQLADWLDTRYRIPGTSFRYGFDTIIGLIPGIGDLITTVLGAYIVIRARQLGAPKFVMALMIANLTIDGIVGAVPILGDLFDMAFKSHVRNVRILLRWLEREEIRRSRRKRVKYADA